MYRDFTIGEYYHVYNRGNRKEKIFLEESDMWRFLQTIRFFNDSHSSLNLFRSLVSLASDVNNIDVNNINEVANSVFNLGWPKKLPNRDPLVKILCYHLSPNHFHLLLKEIRKGGISKFMQKIGIGFSKYSNIKYQNVGRIFQSPYKIKIIMEQRYLEHLMVYIQVINVLELFPGGLDEALKNPKKAISFVDNYSFSSHPDYAGLRKSLIIDKDLLAKIFPSPKKYREFVYQTLKGKNFPQGQGETISQFLGDLRLE